MSKGKDISTMFTKEENKKNGRLGYGQATREKEDIISPAQYGAFLQKRGKKKRSKSVLVIDTPESCSECKIGRDMSGYMEVCIICPIANKVALNEEAETVPDWCPLKPLPEKMTIPRGARNTDDLEYAAGYNTCINEITGKVK